MILEINLEEYLEHNAINNLIGSPAGYVGMKREGSIRASDKISNVSCLLRE